MRAKLFLLLCISFLPFSALCQNMKPRILPDRPQAKSEVKSGEGYADKNFWFATAAMSGSSAAPIIGGNRCRSKNGVEPCIESYGSYWGFMGFNAGMSTFGWPALFYKCRKDTDKSRWCWTIPVGVVAFNIGLGVHQATRSSRHHEEGALLRLKK